VLQRSFQPELTESAIGTHFPDIASLAAAERPKARHCCDVTEFNWRCRTGENEHGMAGVAYLGLGFENTTDHSIFSRMTS